MIQKLKIHNIKLKEEKIKENMPKNWRLMLRNKEFQ
jgi:hypothetical protein